MHIKRYRFSEVFNFRDMGGLYAGNGKAVKWNLLFRSDKLNGVLKEEWEVIKKAGAKTIIDMRSEEEVKMFPDNCPKDFNYIHFPLVEDNLSFNNISSPSMQAFAESVAEGYKNIVLSHGENLAEVINIIADSVKDGGVLFHCTSGKDRTGAVASVLYYMLGVSEEDIIADYEVSYTYNKNRADKFMNDFPQYRKYRSVVLSEAETMCELIKLYKDKDIENYLISKGMKKQSLEYLKEILLEDC